MGPTFLDDFDGENPRVHINEIQSALEKAVMSSPKSTVTANYPQENYEIADLRLNITADLAAIRSNPNNSEALKFIVDARMEAGSYLSEQLPDYAKIEMSYNEFKNLNKYSYIKNVLMPLVGKIMEYTKKYDNSSEPDPFNAFDDIAEERTEVLEDISNSDVVKNSVSENTVNEVNNDSPKTFEELVKEGHKFQAIQVYRETTGADLDEAKKAVETYASKNCIETDSINRENTKHKRHSSGGCLTTLLVIICMIFLFFILPRFLAH